MCMYVSVSACLCIHTLSDSAVLMELVEVANCKKSENCENSPMRYGKSAAL